jgi:hypothetical protein
MSSKIKFGILIAGLLVAAAFSIKWNAGKEVVVVAHDVPVVSPRADASPPEKLCDGLFKPGTEYYCGSNVGECQYGYKTCEPDGTWSQCQGDVGEQTEICDGKDNDCNGAVDDVDLLTDGRHCGKCGIECPWKGNSFCRAGKCVNELAEPASPEPKTVGTITCSRSGKTKKLTVDGDLAKGLKDDDQYIGKIESVSLSMEEGSCKGDLECFKTDLCKKNSRGMWQCAYSRYNNDHVDLTVVNVPSGSRSIEPRVRTSENHFYFLDLTRWKIIGTCARLGCEESCRRGEKCYRLDSWQGLDKYDCFMKS